MSKYQENENDSKMIKKGVIYNYIAMAVNTLSGFLLTPFMVSHLGEAEYSIYQLIVSLAGYLTVVNLGTGASMNRFVTAYREEGDRDKVNNYISLNLLVTCLMMIASLAIGTIMTIYIDKWFPNIINSSDNRILAKELCILLTINVAINFLASSFEGLLQSYGRIDLTKKFGVFRLCVRFAFIMTLLALGFGALEITLVDCGIVVIYLIYLLYTLKKYCDYRFFIRKFAIDKPMFKETFAFSIASLLSSLSGQLNNNIDKSVLAIFCTSFEITIYTVATTFYTIFTSIGVSLNSVFLNRMTELECRTSDNREIEKLNIKIGRFQNFIIGMIFWGLIALGKDFITAWMGDRYIEIYYYAITLIIPNYFVCIGGVQETILDAKNKRLVKSVTVFIIGLLNVAITIFLVKTIGGYGAPLGTMIALILGYNIIINVYMQLKLKINVIGMYLKIMKGYLPAQLMSFAIIMGFVKALQKVYIGSWQRFIIEGILYVIIYFIFAGAIAWTPEERKFIQKQIYDIFYKVKVKK